MDHLWNLTAICCGQRLRWKTIDRTQLVMTYCSRCQVTRWYSDGLPVDRADVVTGNANLAWAEPHLRRKSP